MYPYRSGKFEREWAQSDEAEYYATLAWSK